MQVFIVANTFFNRFTLCMAEAALITQSLTPLNAFGGQVNSTENNFTNSRATGEIRVERKQESEQRYEPVISFSRL